MAEVTEAANNPAGRALWFLEELKTDPHQQELLTTAAAKILGVKVGSADLYRLVTQVRQEIELVPTLMEPYQAIPGYGSIFRHYEQLQAAANQIQLPASYLLSQVIGGIDDAGWASLEFADEVLRGPSVEKRLTADQAQRYLADVQGLIADIVGDGSLSAPDRERLVRLLSEVERALRNIRIFGAIRVEEVAVTAAGVVQVEKDLWDRVASKKWFQRFGKVLGGLLITLGAVGGLPALGMGDEPPPQITVNQDVHLDVDVPAVQEPSQVADSDVVDAEVVDEPGANS